MFPQRKSFIFCWGGVTEFLAFGIYIRSEPGSPSIRRAYMTVHRWACRSHMGAGGVRWGQFERYFPHDAL